MTEPKGAFSDLLAPWVRERIRLWEASGRQTPELVALRKRNRELMEQNDRLREKLRRLRDATEDDHR